VMLSILGRFLKDGDEQQTSFEITSYNANGTVGGATTFNFKWPAVTNGFEVPGVEGKNIALNVPAVDDGAFDPGGRINKINDGVIPSSKWASTKTDASAYLDLGKDMDISRWVVKHANVSGAGEGVDFNTDTFDLQYAADDGQPVLKPEESASASRIINLKYTKVDEVVGNRQDVTDRVLNTPIKARYIKLHVTKSDNCPWHAIRIYEFELYENAYTPHGVPLLDRNVTVKNNVGAKDSVVFNNVAMPIAGDGKLAENTGLVKIYDSLTAQTPIAQVKAVQPDERYKQSHRGVASIENLELKAEGGRLYYTTQENEMVSLRYSVEYAPETGTAITAPTSIKLEHSLKGNQTRSKYGVLTLEGLDVGTYMEIYESADSKSPILHSRPVQEGEEFIRQERIPLAKDSGTIYYELKQSGKADSERFKYTYGATEGLNVDQTSLKDLVNRYSNLNENNYISTTWEPFSKALNDVKALISTEVKASEAEVKRVALEESALSLRSIENIQRLKEVINEYETKYTQDRYSVNSFTRFSDVLEQTKKVVSDAESATKIFTNIELEKSRFDLDYAASHLVEKGDQKVDSVSIIPNDVDGKIGTSLTLKAEVAGNADDTVTWEVNGNTSTNTTISNGILNIAADETVNGILTVKAISTIDTTKSGTAQVLVVSELLPKIVSVTIPDQVDSVKSGSIKQFSSNVVVKNDAATTVTWTVEGAENADTKINNGLLMINEKETAEQIIIKATSVVDPTKFATKTIKVVKTLTVTIDSNIVNGTVKSEQASYTEGETVKLTVTPAEGYGFVRGSLKYNDGTSDVPIDEEQFVMPAKNVTVTATFGKIHKIIIDPNIKNGRIEPYFGTEFVKGDVFLVGFLPSEGYQVKEGTLKYSYDDKVISLDEAVATYPQYKPYVPLFNAPDSDIVITAEFELIPVAETTYAVTIGTIDNGKITADKSTAKEGDTVTLTVTPNEGYQLKTGSLRLNGDVIIGNTFIMSAQIATITAEFELIPVKALVSITTPTAITGLPNGTAKTADALELPATVEIVTDSGNMNADVEWDVASASYDPAVKTEQIFTVNGTVILPEGVVNTNRIPLTTSIEVTVAAATPVTPPSGSGSGTGTTEPVYESTVSGGQVTTATSVKAAIGSNGTAVSKILETQITGAIAKAVTEAAKQGANTAIAIKLDVTAPADAKAVEVALSSESLTKFIDSKADFLIISTPIGTMTFDEKTASSISKQATGTITITAAKVKTSTLPAEVQHKVGDRPVVNFDITSGDKTISQFGGNVTVTIPYTLKVGENPNAIVAYYINTADKYEILRNCKYDPASKTITFKTPHFSKYAVGYNKVDFNDVAISAWYNDAVSFAAARGITSGVSNGNFGVENKVTRAQCLVMIMKAFGINPDENAENNFSDAGNTYYTGYLAAAKRLGLTSGVGSNMFAPKKEVTRQEMFVLTYNTLKSINELPTGTIAKELKDFKDAGTVSAYANDAMTLFVKTGVISGSNGNLLPADKATRAEFVQILYYIMIK
jgi:hypothetical protein